MSRASLTVQSRPLVAEATSAVQAHASVAADRPPRASMRSRGWQLLLEWTLLSSVPLLVTLALKAQLMGWWSHVITLWSTRLELPVAAFAVGTGDSRMWAMQADGTFMPSSQTLTWTWLGLTGLWAITHFFSDRFHPLKVIIRGLCLIQATACVFFMVSPAHFPYTVTQHMHALLDMGYGLMLASGPLLALGWGILTPSRIPKIIAPLGVLAYFAWMLPHKVLLHAWLLTHGSALFMPVLFLSFGMLFDLWVFIALYAWLASRIPRTIHALGTAS
jgi:hypothetical protein